MAAIATAVPVAGVPVQPQGYGPPGYGQPMMAQAPPGYGQPMMAQAVAVAVPVQAAQAQSYPVGAPQPQEMLSPDQLVDAQTAQGCYCTTFALKVCPGTLVGVTTGHCVGLQAKGPDTLEGNPIACCVGVPLCCDPGTLPKVYKRRPGTNLFESAIGEAIELHSEKQMQANFCGSTGCWCLGHPTGLKVCALPECVYSCGEGYNKCCNYPPCFCMRHCFMGPCFFVI
jgi:hypothetical protein